MRGIRHGALLLAVMLWSGAAAAQDTLKIGFITTLSNRNHFPIQSFYLSTVTRDTAGVLGNAYEATIVKDHADSYAEACKMP